LGIRNAKHNSVEEAEQEEQAGQVSGSLRLFLTALS
jgi:hypothetical protein